MKKLSLTFDDGPAAATPAVLDVLARYSVPATFFMIGNRKADHFEIVQSVARAGHRIGDHTWSHSNLTELSEDKLRAELSTSFCRYFRPPYGCYDERTLALLKEMRMQMVRWDCDSFDYALSTADEICSVVEEQMNDEDAIILFHDGDSRNDKADRSVTVEAVDRMIPKYRAQGYEFVSLSEMTLPGTPRKVFL